MLFTVTNISATTLVVGGGTEITVVHESSNWDNPAIVRPFVNGWLSPLPLIPGYLYTVSRTVTIQVKYTGILHENLHQNYFWNGSYWYSNFTFTAYGGSTNELDDNVANVIRIVNRQDMQ